MINNLDNLTCPDCGSLTKSGRIRNYFGNLIWMDKGKEIFSSKFLTNNSRISYLCRKCRLVSFYLSDNKSINCPKCSSIMESECLGGSPIPGGIFWGNHLLWLRGKYTIRVNDFEACFCQKCELIIFKIDRMMNYEEYKKYSKRYVIKLILFCFAVITFLLIFVLWVVLKHIMK